MASNSNCMTLLLGPNNKVWDIEAKVNLRGLGLWVVISGEGPQPLTPFWFDGDPVAGIDVSHQGEPATVAVTPDGVELLCRSPGNDSASI
jgi:hypothetical protein